MNKTARLSGQNPECSDCPLIQVGQFLGKENIINLYILVKGWNFESYEINTTS